MLVLTRKLGETIKIGDQIEVSISSIVPHRVKLAISAPTEVTIVRAELVQSAAGDRLVPQAAEQQLG